MAENDPNPNPNPNPNPAPWYTGADAELVGHITNKGWNTKPVNDVALEAIKAHREAEKFIGAPASQLVRLPTDPNDEAGWNGVYQKLGAPADKTGYDFAEVKNAKGEPVTGKVIDSVREIAAALHLPKAAAVRLAQEVLKLDVGRSTEDAAAHEARLIEQRAALDKNWGNNKAINFAIAKEAAAKLGIEPEAVAALEGVIGYDKVMEAFRKIGVAVGEAGFKGGGDPQDPNSPKIMSVDQAKARLTELKNDNAWAARYMAGGNAEVREMNNLHTIIASGS